MTAANSLGNHLNKLTPLVKVDFSLHEDVRVLSSNVVCKSHGNLTIGHIEGGYIGLGDADVSHALADLGELIGRAFYA